VNGYPTTYDELLNFLKRPRSDEGLDHDFKIGLPHTGDKEGVLRLNRCFCAFANTRGGIIYFGIDDDKKCIGVEPNKEFLKHLSDKLSKAIKPEIVRWSLLDPIPLPDNSRSIRPAHIQECPSHQKPHLFEGVAYFRVGSSCVPMLDGADLRRRLEVDRFSPNHIDILESKLQGLATFNLIPDELDVLYLNKLQVFLDERVKSEDIARLRSSFMEIRKLFAKLIKISSPLSMETSISSPLDELQELQSKTALFIKQFKQVFFGGVESI
jgi:Putative DNA-binding domain